MNDELIKQLQEERSYLFPNGCPIQPRGCGKTYLYLYLFLKYSAYDIVCERYWDTDVKIDLETAHHDMNTFIADLVPEW